MKPVVLVACSDTKAPMPCEARRFYQGGVFKLSVEFALSKDWEWAIISAKHGLLMPGDIVNPYDFTVSERAADRGKVAEWAKATKAQLEAKFPKRHFVSLLPERYEACLAEMDFESPLKGLGIGSRQGWLARNSRLKQEDLL